MIEKPNAELDPAAIAYFEGLVGTASDQELVEAAKAHSQFTRGFRPERIDAKVLRLRIQSAVQSSRDSPATLDVLRGLSLQRRLVGALSEELIKRAERSLANYFGTLALYSAMSIDPRQAVAELAQSRFKVQGSKPHRPPDERSLGSLLQDLGPFVEVMRSVLDAPGVAALGGKGALARAPGASERPQTALNPAQLQRAIDASAPVRRLRRQLKVAEGRLEAEATARSAAQGALMERTQQCQSLGVELDSLKSRFASSVDARVDDLFVKRLGTLFASADLLAGRGASRALHGGDGALAFARQVLEAQAQSDVRFGTRSRLTEELEEASRIRAQLREAQHESIRPLEQIPEAVARLDRLISELETRLELTRAVPEKRSPAFSRFFGDVNTSSRVDDLLRLRQQLEAIRASGQWSAAELTDAEEALSHAALRFYADHVREMDFRDRDALAGASPLNALRIALARSRPAWLIVDGHNVMHQLRHAWGPMFENGVPGQRVREHLQGLLLDLAQTYPALEVDLWFDSPEMREESLCATVRVRYSGGTGPDRADMAIEAALRHAQGRAAGPGAPASPEALVLVVSADRDVRSAAAALGAKAMHPTELALLIGC